MPDSQPATTTTTITAHSTDPCPESCGLAPQLEIIRFKRAKDGMPGTVSHMDTFPPLYSFHYYFFFSLLQKFRSLSYPCALFLPRLQLASRPPLASANHKDTSGSHLPKPGTATPNVAPGTRASPDPANHGSSSPYRAMVKLQGGRCAAAPLFEWAEPGKQGKKKKGRREEAGMMFCYALLFLLVFLG